MPPFRAWTPVLAATAPAVEPGTTEWRVTIITAMGNDHAVSLRGKIMNRQAMPRAALEPRPGDIFLRTEQLLRLSLFAGLKRKPNLERFPGAIVLRSYRAGETICWQGEPGWTAFFLLTTDDVLGLLAQELVCGPSDRQLVAEQMERLRRRLEGENSALPEDNESVVGSVHIAIPRERKGRKPDLGRLMRAGGRPVPWTAVPGRDLQTLYVPVDGPPTLSYDTLRAPLHEGELFGEASCLYRTPRPATVVVSRDCFVLEMLRNILDQMCRDAAFRTGAEEIYRRRAAVEWRKLSLFADLTDEQFNRLRTELELLRVEPGTVIRDEHEAADAVYLVFSGLVQVARDVSSLLAVDAVANWDQLCAVLKAGAEDRLRPQARLWQLLVEVLDKPSRLKLDAQRLSVKERDGLIDGLNAVLARPGLIDEPAFKSLVEAWPLCEALEGLLKQRQELRRRGRALPDREARRANRLLLEALLPGALHPLRTQAGPPTILGYCARGEWFGETALVRGKPHEATFTAHGHPNHDGLVGLVRIPASAFGRLLGMAPSARDRVKAEAARRSQAWQSIMRSPLLEESGPPHLSTTFEELGLIQGEKLMLIDLDRCTRCGECVQACVQGHSDGAARLTLAGPRFGKYLVPTTCRGCLDPVCLTDCPVGAIRRGTAGQIVIENWCIGCGLCADNCPYGAIQMQDQGLIPERAGGWRFMPSEVVRDGDWPARRFRDSGWLTGEAPFHFDRDLFEELADRRKRGTRTGPPGSVLFRYSLALARGTSTEGRRFRIEVGSTEEVTVWVNGVEAVAESFQRRGRYVYSLCGNDVGSGLGPGMNVLAVRVGLPGEVPRGELLLRLRLDEVRPPLVPPEGPGALAEEVTERQVTHLAAVCDLCAGTRSRGPACVRACPHEAALRVNARWEFPRT
jgi:Fe-S-cluster-containing hydrogenase component 2/CRP-like cAMP-binding protein